MYVDPYFVFSSNRSLVYFVKISVHFLSDLLGRERLGGLDICFNGLALTFCWGRGDVVSCSLLEVEGGAVGGLLAIKYV